MLLWKRVERERDDLKSVRFQFLKNMLILEVYVIQNFLNLKISVPPSFKFQMRGLVGYYEETQTTICKLLVGSILNSLKVETLKYSTVKILKRKSSSVASAGIFLRRG